MDKHNNKMGVGTETGALVGGNQKSEAFSRVSLTANARSIFLPILLAVGVLGCWELAVRLSNQAVPVPGVPGLSLVNIDPDEAAVAYRQRVIDQMGPGAADADKAVEAIWPYKPRYTAPVKAKVQEVYYIETE